MAKIVVCDDEPHIVHGLRYLFEADGHDVRAVYNGMEAIELIAQDKPDLLVTDIMMPKMSGFEVVERLRSSPKTASLLIIMLTAKGQRADAEHAERIGVTEFVTKPFSPLALRERINRLLSKSCEAVS